ncbi:hypothetical protein LC613_30215 [Nostoc sphaeroides CHAB 2801]|uniref:hypothetical protein n=1 Tax=Nostoc sphaeroides TaxID=446679 RepID=UPI001E530096|nr:hypothetical protein [Nostoc sphaeroides]MCC5631964.1 hypothetical protein [Nostoc sphaeroides CHAB 2801]
MTQVVRQGTGSPLLEFVTASRYAVTNSKFPFEPYAKYLPDKSNGALMVKRQTLLRYACKKMKREFAQNPDCFRILSWTNTQVDFYNQQIRTHLYGENINRFIPGERLITRDPVMAPDGKTTILSTSTEFTVLDVFGDRYNNYDTWRLKVETDEGIVRQIYVLHEDSLGQMMAHLENVLENASVDAKKLDSQGRSQLQEKMDEICSKLLDEQRHLQRLASDEGMGLTKATAMSLKLR